MNTHLLFLTLLIITGCNSKLAELDRISPVDFFVKHFGAESQLTATQYSLLDRCNSIATDRSGNIYCGGITNGDFADTNNDRTFFRSDALIIKMDPQGNVIWVTQLGDAAAADVADPFRYANFDDCNSIAVDAAENVYCAGSTNSNMAGPGSLSGGNGRDGFVMKLNSSGELVWVKLVGAPLTDEFFRNIALHASGDVIAVGDTFGEVVATEGVNGSDAYVSRLSSLDGTVRWTTQLGQTTLLTLARPAAAGIGNEFATEVTIGRDGVISVVGFTTSDLGETNAGSPSGNDLYLWRLNSSGTSLSLKQFGATSAPYASGEERVSGLTVDEKGDLFWAGGTSSDFADLYTGTGEDAFVMKTTNMGEIIWKTQLGSNNLLPGGDHSQNDRCNSLALNKFSLYCLGFTLGSVGEANPLPGVARDIFILEVNHRTGSIKDRVQFGTTTAFPGGSNFEDDFPGGIIADDRDRIFATGQTRSSFSEPHAGNQDIFIFKLDDNHRPNKEYIQP